MTTGGASQQTLAEALAQAARQGLARLDAQLLLLHAMSRKPGERAWLIAHDDEALGASQQHRFEALCARRVRGEPVAYLVGMREFHGLELQVDRRVLVPRPDTETLVEWALALMAPLVSPRVLDLGTGSGAIALALQHARPDAHVEAVDRSAEALAVAGSNARRLGLAVRFRQASWLEGTAASDWDLIVSNPPYVADTDPHLQDLADEPREALVAGPEGLDDLFTLIDQSPRCLRNGGWLLLEHGHDQAQAVRARLAERGWAEVQSRLDLGGVERCSGGRRPA